MASSHPHAHYHQAEGGAWVGITGNIALGLVKLAGGIFGASSALVADAAHSLSDSASSVVVLAGLRIARKPPHRSHPYGHGKAETIAGLVVALMLVGVALFVGYTAISKIAWAHTPAPPAKFVLYIALGSILVKEGMFQYKIRLGRRLGSESLIADAWHHRSDALSSICVVAGISLALLHKGLWVMDPVAALLVCAVILWVGLKSFRRTSSVLMDVAADEETLRAIRDVAKSVPGVMDTEKLITRRSGLDVLVTIHVEVDPGISVREAHETAGLAREAIMDAVQNVTQVTVHIEPYYPDDHVTQDQGEPTR